MPPKKKGKEILLKTNPYPDKAELESEAFPDLELQIKDPNTAILLLSSEDKNTLIKTLHHLDSFAQKRPENAALLQNCGLIEKILENKLFEHVELFVKRFSLKLVSELVPLEGLKLDKAHLEHIFQLAKEYFVSESDDFVVEYVAVILVCLLKEPRFVINLEEDKPFIVQILRHIEGTVDPDILFNCYQLIIQLFKSVISPEQICSIGRFPFERVLGDVCSEFPEIQKSALQAFKAVVCCQSDDYVSRFCCPVFFEEMMKVLENPDWVELHMDVIDVLEHVMSMQAVATEFCNESFLVRFLAYMKLDSALRMPAAGVLAEILRYPSLFDVLYNFGVPEKLLELLDTSDTDISAQVLLGIKRFLNHLEAFMKIVNHDPVGQLLKLIKNEFIKPNVREAAADTLKVLTSRNKHMCESCLNSDIGPIAAKILDRPFGEVNPDLILHLVQILVNLASYHEIRAKVMSNAMAWSLIGALQNSNRSSLLMANLMNCICIYSCEETMQEQLLNNDVAALVMRSLKNSAVLVKTSAADLILLTANSPLFSETYIENGVLEILLQDDKSLITCPAWSLAINAILTANPSLKFCIRNRLEITDFCGEDFIVSKKPMKNFKVFRSCVKDEVSPLTSFLLMNFSHLKCPSATIVRLNDCCPDSTQNGDVSFSDLEDWCYCRRPNDENLPKLLQELRHLLEIKALMDTPQTQNKLINISKIGDRAKVLAELVAREMCGSSPGLQSEVCSEQVVLSHLNFLKCHLHCNIIPLGMIKFGGQLERAVLFKGLADKIGLPCTLQRGVDGRIMYNEIPLPVDEKGKCGLKVLPTQLLQPSHIVDLMDNPGMLYPIESRQAYHYLQLL